MNIIDIAMLLFILGAIPVGFTIFTNKKVNYRNLDLMVMRYRWAILIIFFMYLIKNILDAVNDPIRDAFQLDFTGWIYAVEGDATLHIQQAMMNDYLTVFLAIVYLIGFLFVFNFSFLLFAFVDERKVAHKIVLVNFVSTLISIPFFLFFPVFVTSWPAMDHSLDPNAPLGAGIKGMEPLMYNIHPKMTEFFIGNDPFDNCVPSLHVAVPLATTYMILKHSKGFRGYAWFIGIITALITISVIYLGIHWILDIVAAILVVIATIYIVEKCGDRFWRKVYRTLEPFWWKRIRGREPREEETWTFD